MATRITSASQTLRFRMAPLGEIHRIITDGKIKREMRRPLEKAGPEPVIVDVQQASGVALQPYRPRRLPASSTDPSRMFVLSRMPGEIPRLRRTGYGPGRMTLIARIIGMGCARCLRRKGAALW